MPVELHKCAETRYGYDISSHECFASFMPGELHKPCSRTLETQEVLTPQCKQLVHCCPGLRLLVPAPFYNYPRSRTAKSHSLPTPVLRLLVPARLFMVPTA
eukprot:1140132-Pelagomonas_calceolata.AAC.4